MKNIKNYINWDNAPFWSWLINSLFYRNSKTGKIEMIKREELTAKINELTSQGDFLTVRELLSQAESTQESLSKELVSRSFRITTPAYFKLIAMGFFKERALSKVLAVLLAKKIKEVLFNLNEEEIIADNRVDYIKNIIDQWLEEMEVDRPKHSRKHYYISCDWEISPELQKKLSRLVYYHFGEQILGKIPEMDEKARMNFLKTWWDQFDSIFEKSKHEFFELWLFFNKRPKERIIDCEFWINYYYCIAPFLSSLEKVLSQVHFEVVRKEVTHSNKSDYNEYEGVNFPVEMTLLNFFINLTDSGELLVNDEPTLKDPENLIKIFNAKEGINLTTEKERLQKLIQNQDFQKARKLADYLTFCDLKKEIVHWLQQGFTAMIKSSQVVSVTLPKSIYFFIQAFREQIDISKQILETEDEVIP